jgi:heme/copper-type cytochrome/quinol oxidase subunit 2
MSMSGLLWFLAQGTNLDLKVFQFRPQAGNVSNQIVATVMVAIVVVAFGIVAYFFFRHRRQLAELNLQRRLACAC